MSVLCERQDARRRFFFIHEPVAVPLRYFSNDLSYFRSPNSSLDSRKKGIHSTEFYHVHFGLHNTASGAYANVPKWGDSRLFLDYF